MATFLGSSENKEYKTSNDVSEKEIINEIFKSEATNLIRKAMRRTKPENVSNPFGQSYSEYLTSVFLTGTAKSYQFDLDTLQEYHVSTPSMEPG